MQPSKPGMTTNGGFAAVAVRAVARRRPNPGAVGFVLLCMVEVAQHRGDGDEGCGRSHHRVAVLGCPKWAARHAALQSLVSSRKMGSAHDA